MIFDNPVSTLITDKFLKENGWEKDKWGSPDYFKNIKGFNLPRWSVQSKIWYKSLNEEKNIYVYYFPRKFHKYICTKEKYGFFNNCILIVCEHNWGDYTELLKENIKTINDMMLNIEMGVREIIKLTK